MWIGERSPGATVHKHGAASAAQGEGRIHSVREHKSLGAPIRPVSWGEKNRAEALFFLYENLFS